MRAQGLTYETPRADLVTTLEVSSREVGFDPATEKLPKQKPLENIETKRFQGDLEMVWSDAALRNRTGLEGVVEVPNGSNRRFRREIGEDRGDSRKSDENYSDGAV